MAAMTGSRDRDRPQTYAPLAGAPSGGFSTDFSMAVDPGAFVCLLGPSGIGKTTLLNMISGLDTDYSGRIEFCGEPHPRLGYVFQTPRLLPWRTVLENILLPLPSTEAARTSALDLLAEHGNVRHPGHLPGAACPLACNAASRLRGRLPSIPISC